MAHHEAHELSQALGHPAGGAGDSPRLVTDGGSDAGTTRHGITFEHVLDAVVDLGMDPTGQRPVDEAIETSATDGTLVEFPPGEYRIEERHLLGDIEGYGWVGTGEDRSEVRFTTTTGGEVTPLVVYGGRGILLENVTFDQGDRAHGSSLGNIFVVEDGLQVRDVAHTGFNPAGIDGAPGVTSLACRITDPDGVGIIEGFTQVGPSDQRRDGGAPAAIWYGNPVDSAGTLYVRECHVENAPGPGIHGSHTNGSVQVEGGVFSNNGVANVRLAGAGSSIRNATVIVDAEAAHADTIGGGRACGVWAEGGYTGVAGPRIEGCDLRMVSVTGPSQGLLRIDSSAGETVVRDTHLENAVRGIHTVYARTPGEWGGTPPEPRAVRLVDVTITGQGGAGQAVLIEGRDGSRVEGSTVRTGHGDGIVFRGASDCAVDDTAVGVPGRAVVFDDAVGATTNLRMEAPVETEYRESQPAATGDRLRIEGEEGDDAVSYRLAVDGSVDHSATIDRIAVDNTGERTVVTGWVETTPHRLVVDGSVVAADFECGQGRFYRNDEPVTAADLTTAAPARRLTIASDGTGVSSYEFTVDGSLTVDPTGDSYTPPENVSGPTAEGAVNESVDSYRFSGEITAFALRGLATVRLDGEVVDPTRLGSSPNRKVLRVESRDGRPVNYRLTAAGTLCPVSASGPHQYRAEAGGRTTVEGQADAAASWATPGRFLDFEAQTGSGRLFLNDALVGPNELGATTRPNRVRLSGTPGAGYELRVSGQISDDEDADVGATVSGTLDEEPTEYQFNGSVESLSVDEAVDAVVSFTR